MKSIEQVLKRQREVLDAMGNFTVMRRGTLSTQVYAERRARKDGAGAAGPYFVWQGSVDGKHFSRRVSAEGAAQLASEVENRRAFERLAAEYVALGEELALLMEEQEQGREALKKKPRLRWSNAKK